jgi:hypothetical protein
MANRTELVCMCEGKKGRSIDSVFINRLIRSLRQTDENIVPVFQIYA